MLSYYEYDNKQKKVILFLKFAFTTSCCKTSQKCKIYQQCFSRKKGKNDARIDKLCQKFCQPNLSKPCSRRFEVMGARKNGGRITFKHLYSRRWSKPPKFEWRKITSIKFLKSFFSRCFVFNARPRVQDVPEIQAHSHGKKISFLYIIILLQLSQCFCKQNSPRFCKQKSTEGE